MISTRGIGLLIVMLTACAGPRQRPPSEPLTRTANPPETAVVEPAPPPEPAPAAAATPPPPAMTQAPPAKPPVRVHAPPPPVEQGLSPARPAPPAPPPLDLKSLAARLKDTHAIGFFTKVALKNQVDDLVSQFRAFYEGRSQTTLAALRRPYDLLLLKVLALLQDSDPPLASAIVASREAIWGVLADRTSFATI